MKLLYVAPRYHTNQVPIMEYLVRNGHEVHFLAYRKELTEDYHALTPDLCHSSLIYKIREYLFFRKNRSAQSRENFKLSKFLPSGVWLYSYIRKIKPEVVIIRGKKLSSAWVHIICKMCGVKNVILYTHDECFVAKPVIENPLKTKLKALIYPKENYSPVEYREVKREDAPFATGVNFFPFAMNFDSNLIQGRTYMQDGMIRILDIGKFRNYKNHFVLARAAAILSPDIREQIHITILGQAYTVEEKAYRHRLKQFIVEHQIENMFDVLDAVPYEQMPSVYLSHDVFVCASKSEDASTCLVEAMTFGDVCVSTDHNGTASYIQPDLGFLFETDNEQSLMNVLSTICERKKDLPEMGMKTFKYAKEHYSTDAYFKNLQTLL